MPPTVPYAVARRRLQLLTILLQQTSVTRNTGRWLVSNRRITFFIALALFAQESTWNFYDNQVPVLLRQHVTSAALVGALMGMDNLLGIFVQPWVGNRSDNTRTRWGRRMPYLAVGMPVAALIFLLLPWAPTLPALIGVMLLYALIANTMRTLAVSLVLVF